MKSSRYTDVPTVRGPASSGRVLTRRRVTAFVAALAITFVVPSSEVWARKPAPSAPAVTVLDDAALGGLGSESTPGAVARATSSSTGARSSSTRR